MPHLVTNRPRVGNPGQQDPDNPSHDQWEQLSSAVYGLGGLTFITGSIFFLPALSSLQYLGDWLFFAGSLLYLLVTGHDLLEVLRFWRLFATETLAQTLEFTASFNYVGGSVLFALGSLFFLPDWGWSVPGAWCFIVGSAAFVVGANVNLLQVVEAPSLVYLELFNLTVAAFAVGSMLFFVASIPFIWHFHNSSDSQLVLTYVAWEYIGGSILFLIGGVFIYWRHYMRRASLVDDRARTSGLIRLFRREINRYGRLKSGEEDG